MTYRELIDLYKSGNLNEQQKAKVEKDIERQEAISEYLFEEGEIPELGELGKDFQKNGDGEDFTVDINNAEIGDDELKFAKMIRSSIRKAFIKMGVIVSGVVLAIVLFVIFALPKVVDLFYYNPAEIVGEKDGTVTNRLSLDLMVFSELLFPESYREQVDVEEEGYGEYNIKINQYTSYTGTCTNVGGKIERNKLTMYDINFLNSPLGNGLVSGLAGVKTYIEAPGAAGSPEDAKNALKNLKDDEYYTAYVTLSEVMDYDSFVKWCEENPVAAPNWCAIAKKRDSGFESDVNIGFILSSNCCSAIHEEEYPYLTQWDIVTAEDAMKDSNLSELFYTPEEIMRTHVVSMFRYMAEQKTFNKMMGCEIDYEYWAYNVEENGLNIYGFVMTGQKEDIIEVSNLDKVAYVYTKEIR